jgi:Amidohydrolase family/Carbohydrate binding domain (family 11)
MLRLPTLILSIALLTCGAVLAVDQAPPLLAIVGAQIVDGSGEKPRAGNLILDNGRITAVGPSVRPPAGATLIDGAGRTVLPGLIDVEMRVGPGGPIETDAAGRALAASLFAGVTTAAVAGVSPAQYASLREGASKSWVTRVLLMGGPEDVRAAVQAPADEPASQLLQLFPFLPDIVLLDATRRIAGEGNSLPALAYEVRNRNVRFALLAWRPDDLAPASSLGSSLVIGAFDSIKGPALGPGLVKGNVTMAPRLTEVATTAQRSPTRLFADVAGAAAAAAPVSATAAEARWASVAESVRSLRDQRVRLALASNGGAPGLPQGWAAHLAVRLLVDAGLSPVEALAAATSGSARALGLQADRGLLAPGMRADVVMVQGDPIARITDMEQVERVLVDGREVDRSALRQRFPVPVQPIPQMTAAPPPTAPGASGAAPASTTTAAAEAARDSSPPSDSEPKGASGSAAAPVASALLDDFERDDESSNIGSSWSSASESGNRPTTIVMGRVVRGLRDHALLLSARMGDGRGPFARVSLKLNADGRPVDVSGYRGIRFDARGEGRYRVTFITRRVTDGRYHDSYFSGSPVWTPVRIPFSSVGQNGAGVQLRWTGRDLVEIRFEIARDAGKMGWLELDNLSLY